MPKVNYPEIAVEKKFQLQKIQLAAARVRLQANELQESIAKLDQLFRKEVEEIAKGFNLDPTTTEFNPEELAFVDKKSL